MPFDDLATGERAIIDPWTAWFGRFPDATGELRSLIAMGDHVVAQGLGRGTHQGAFDLRAGRLKPSGRQLETDLCDVYRLRASKVLRADTYFDFYNLLSRLAPEKRPAATPATERA